jgi:hypothetical protein
VPIPSSRSRLDWPEAPLLAWPLVRAALTLTGFSALLLVAACPARSPEAPGPTASDAQAEAASADGGLAPTDGSPAPVDGGLASPGSPDSGLASPDGGPQALPLVLAEATLGGGGAPLAREGLTLVEPGSSFHVEVQARLADARLVLLDAQDAMVPVKGELEIGPVSRFRLSPAEPLRPGGTYTLRLEGIAGREVHDALGRAYQPLSLQFRSAGERPTPPPGKKRKRGKRHR